MTKWQKKLTKKQRKHLADMGIFSLRSLRRNIDHQSSGGAFGCHECAVIFNRLTDAGVKV